MNSSSFEEEDQAITEMCFWFFIIFGMLTTALSAMWFLNGGWWGLGSIVSGLFSGTFLLLAVLPSVGDSLRG